MLKTILDNTEPTNPDYGPLSEQYPKLKKLLLDLDRLIESRQNAELMNLLSNITPQTTILVAARRFVKQEVFTALVPCSSGVKEQAMQFVLFDDLLLYGTMVGISYNLQGRFYLSAYCLLALSIVDSTVELEDDVIIMQDAEKSLYFFEREGGVCKGSVISMWFQLIEDSILSTKKRHYICDVCNMNCEIMSDKSTPKHATAASSKGPLQAVICRGCGRVICSNCMVDMMSFQRSDADDKTVFCLHCRNNERSRWEKPSCEYRVRPSGQRWQRAVSGGGDSVALLYGLTLLREDGGFRLAACHVQHGLRGESSRLDQLLTEDLCPRWNVPLAIREAGLQGDMDTPGMETLAREKRRELFVRCMDELSADALLTAHHRDDQAETVLMHLLRGAGS